VVFQCFRFVGLGSFLVFVGFDGFGWGAGLLSLGGLLMLLPNYRTVRSRASVELVVFRIFLVFSVLVVFLDLLDFLEFLDLVGFLGFIGFAVFRNGGRLLILLPSWSTLRAKASRNMLRSTASDCTIVSNWASRVLRHYLQASRISQRVLVSRASRRS
jgi:hypothetical protein